jgi:hypothetical protein
VTRYHNKKSAGLTVLLALIVAMALGLTELTGDNQADTLVHEFGELLEGVEAEILAIPMNAESFVDTSNTMQTEKIQAQIAYLKAFDEVIRKHIL